jgi:hypothetical protein
MIQSSTLPISLVVQNGNGLNGNTNSNSEMTVYQPAPTEQTLINDININNNNHISMNNGKNSQQPVDPPSNHQFNPLI